MWTHFDSNTTLGVLTYGFLFVLVSVGMNSSLKTKIQSWDPMTFEFYISCQHSVPPTPMLTETWFYYFFGVAVITKKIKKALTRKS